MSHYANYSVRSALFTDLYELTMSQAYLAEGMDQPAVFELFFRQLPETRNFMIAAGLEDVLSYLEELHFEEEDLNYLQSQNLFSQPFLKSLQTFRFTGDVYALPEGTPVFPNEPIIQVVAPILQAQLIETYALNQIHFQTVAASKAARVVLAARGKDIVEFGCRRAHGIDAGLKVARVSYMMGAVGTSNVLAGKLYGIPIFGTMAHSYVQAHDEEMQAFEAFNAEFPKTTLLVDTYDTLQGVQKVIDLSKKLGDRFHVRGIRLDSGDLAQLAKKSRQMLDEAGLHQVRIFASSNLDEYQLDEILESGAPVDAFGVGTRLACIEDAPYVDVAYKLVEYAGKGRLKISSSKFKSIYPGRKQVFREIDVDGIYQRDMIGRQDEQLTGLPLLQPVMKAGKRLPAGKTTLEQSRQYAMDQLSKLPQNLRQIQKTKEPYPVEFSPALLADQRRISQEVSHPGH